jgi:predicted acyl esterase
VQATSRGVTLLGRPRITGTVTTHGRFGQIDARVWDRSGGRQRLITRGAYRLEDNQKGRFSFTLDGNGWRFAKGHRIVVELLGRDAPTYGPSPTRFAAKLRRVEVALPLRR